MAEREDISSKDVQGSWIKLLPRRQICPFKGDWLFYLNGHSRQHIDEFLRGEEVIVHHPTGQKRHGQISMARFENCLYECIFIRRYSGRAIEKAHGLPKRLLRIEEPDYLC